MLCAKYFLLDDMVSEILRRLSKTQHCLHQRIILRLFGKLMQNSKVATWKEFQHFPL